MDLGSLVPEGSPFPIQNLPLGVAQLPDGSVSTVVRIGDHGVVVRRLEEADLWSGPAGNLHGLGRQGARDLRGRVSELLKTGRSLSEFLVEVSALRMLVPYRIHAFVDFYSGIHHASNVGKMFRPEMPPLLPNYRHLPVAYNGRASTVFPTGTTIVRPKGQIKPPNAENPIFGPTKELDFELELGFFVSDSSVYGAPLSVEEAEERMMGLVLVNDWSAREVQRWEYQPLGPFLAKSFATSVSPWVVSLDALEPFRVAGVTQEPPVLPHLSATRPHHFDLTLEVAIRTAAMSQPQIVTRSNARHMYWSFAQQLAHLTSNDCNCEEGDLYASGTISGPEPESFGSLLELTWRGTKPLTMEETGETRTFLEDGDTVIMTAFAERDGLKIGFGEVRGTVLPAT